MYMYVQQYVSFIFVLYIIWHFFFVDEELVIVRATICGGFRFLYSIPSSSPATAQSGGPSLHRSPSYNRTTHSTRPSVAIRVVLLRGRWPCQAW